ncbi:hypothetical protein E2C01_095075 [Portunus trituberculatus]|uniref:Uncharacterized protein n=1 Tax=Portunus trituberculatus TaxID=210409 RepID=A0A5B7K2L4_PORTR|nr:hypothetical protein [Portunus trituberculatus]
MKIHGNSHIKKINGKCFFYVSALTHLPLSGQPSALSKVDVEGPAVAGSARFSDLKKEDMEEGPERFSMAFQKILNIIINFIEASRMAQIYYVISDGTDVVFSDA